KTQEIYDRAGVYLMNNEFDKAENLYNQILFENKQDADAYWNVLMCRYGVTYVKDPASGQYIPTCNRTLFTPIFNDENYQNAIKYADDNQKALYEQNAKTIDDIQRGILAVSKKEKPFDIFVSYKEAAANGGRTKDSIVAQDLYEKLTEQGYKVFFSRITLEDKIGAEYEPYIYAALASSKVMITVCSSKENIEAVWVKNEWSRFLSFAQKDSSKTILPLYFDMDKSELPDEFAHLPSYDMKKDGFEQDLIRGIKKLIPLPVMLAERRKKRNKIIKRVGIAAVACAVVAVICSIPWLMKLPEYNAAMQLYYDKNYPEATWAFDDLGSYRDSNEMKDKCELSWRKSLANVIIETYDGARGDGTYYIDNNGSLQRTDMSMLNSDLKAGQHGKIVSLAPNNKVNVIYEDGYVSNVSDNVSDKEKWNDIIMMSDYFDNVTIALRADGTMVYDVITENKVSSGNNVDWMKPLTKWKDIVSFCAEKTCSNGYNYDSAIIVGVKADGTLESVVYKGQGYLRPCDFCKDKNFDISGFNDIKYFKANYDAFFVAINNSGYILSQMNGVFDKRKYENAVEVFTGDSYHPNIYVLNNDGCIVDMYSDIVLLKDIVHISDYYAISRNGNVYFTHYYEQYEKKSSVKVPVYDEWLERMR
ncbi:MAG: toll/interleukin-1 receptor domain-containing protein, partial [Clostridia bacterium]|nr:toll/interleukin-1 receptor domain-containing protein [Clostridia bacterium]